MEGSVFGPKVKKKRKFGPKVKERRKFGQGLLEEDDFVPCFIPRSKFDFDFGRRFPKLNSIYTYDIFFKLSIIPYHAHTHIT